MSVTRTLRFGIGLALVAGGIQLVGPLALKLAAVGRSAAVDAGSSRSVIAAPGQPGAGGMPAAPAAPQAFMPPAAIGLESAAAAWQEPLETAAPDSGGGLQWDRSPPPPPAPLPSVPHELAQAAPSFGAAYRSTLRVPPPDLLDAAAPPPRGPWSAPDPAMPDRAPTPAPRLGMIPQAGGGDLTVPATYRIADGDDLGTIAGRFYGHPAAASAIWAANRDSIPDPALLPIGAELRLPPPWAVTSPRQAPGGAIEPAAYARPVAMTASSGATAGSGGTTWLPPSPAPLPTAANVGSQSGFAPPMSTATSVRVGPGDTLATLAQRLYGDPAAAAEIFAVNRDRLRSPELVVVGMELRLPRPVTAPRS
jgi:nucleoid-associated protein YgaU